MGHSKGRTENEVHSDTALPKKIETFQKQPNPTSTRTGGTTINKAQSQYKEGNNQDHRMKLSL